MIDISGMLVGIEDEVCITVHFEELKLTMSKSVLVM